RVKYPSVLDCPLNGIAAVQGMDTENPGMRGFSGLAPGRRVAHTWRVSHTRAERKDASRPSTSTGMGTSDRGALDRPHTLHQNAQMWSNPRNTTLWGEHEEQRPGRVRARPGRSTAASWQYSGHLCALREALLTPFIGRDDLHQRLRGVEDIH